jgi:hypothetical protein
MHKEERQVDAAASQVGAEGTQLSRRQAIGRLSAIATAGAAAWVVPEILTAKPAGGATLSVVTNPATASVPVVDGDGPEKVSGGSSPSPATALAYTGLNIQRDTEIGAALIAGGWALHHWASRTPTPTPTPAPASTPEAEAPADPT